MWKKFLFTILVCLLFLSAAEFATDYYMKRYPRLKSSYISQVKQNADILVLGACEAAMMVDPSLLDSSTGLKTYNLGDPGARFADNYLDLYQYLKFQKAPKYLLLQVSPESFYPIEDKLLTTYKHQAFLSDTVVFNVIKELDPEYVKFSSIPFLKYSYYNIFSMYKIFGSIGYSLLNKKHPEDRDGFIPPPLFNLDTSALSESNVITLNSYTWNNTEEKYFRKIISLCKNRGISIVFYKLPYYHNYYNANLELKKYEERIRHIATENNYPYFTYDTSRFTNDSKNYYKLENNLLNGNTIPEFNKMLIRDLKDSVFIQ